MKLTITSDLHLDFWINPTNNANKQEKQMHLMLSNLLPEDLGDVIVVAGDIGHYNKQNAIFFKVLRKYFKHVVWVFGNHDLYMVSKNIAKQFDNNSYNRLENMIQFSSEIDGVHYLNGNIFEYDGVKIGGTGLWYDDGYANKVWGVSQKDVKLDWLYTMNDSNLIRVPNQDGNPGRIDFISFCNSEKEKLNSIIESLDVIVTHVSPDWSRIPLKYNKSSSTFWYFDGSYLIEKTNQRQIWVHGHTHDSHYYELSNRSTIICNPLGYPDRGVEYNSPKIREHGFLTVDVGNIPSYDDIFANIE